jgi:uncharacterized membrane protein/protein-disulfide isomerase
MTHEVRVVQLNPVPHMTPRTRWLIVGLALAGLAFATSSAWVHYRLLTDARYVSPCDINATFNCTQAYLSRYGSVSGVPVAVGGVAWFALVAIVAGLARPSADRSSSATGSYVFVLATIGLASVLRLAYASYVILKVVCLLCLGTYASVLGIFVVSALATSIPVTRLPRRLLGDLRALAARPLMLTVALLYLGGVTTAVAFFPREMRQQTTVPPPPAQDEQTRFAEAWAQQPRIDLGIPPGGAKVVIVKFNDWLCPTCKLFHFQYQPVLDKYAKTDPGAVKYVLKDFPLSTNCNAFIGATKPGHESSCEAAAAVRMARDHGKAEAMIDWLFTNQDHLVDLNMRHAGGPEAIKARAKEMLGIADFDREYALRLPGIRQDVADGGALKFKGTPAYYVNGVDTSASGYLPPEYLDMAIRIELGKGRG